MNIDKMVQHSLNKYNFKINELGIQCITVQILLLYGKHPTIQQVNEIVENNKISYINEHKKVTQKVK